MRILIVRIASKISGAEIYTFIMQRQFKNYADVSLHFLSDNPVFTKTIRDASGQGDTIVLPIGEIGTKKHFLKAVCVFPGYIYQYLKVLRGLEKKGKFDLLVFESMTEKIFLTPLMRMLGYPVIWIEHGPLYVTQRAKIIKLLYTLMSRLTRKIIVVSDDSRKDLVQGFVPEKKIIVIYPWIELSQFTPLTAEERKKQKTALKIPQTDTVVTFMSKINEAKGIKEFIAVAETILTQKTDIHFVIIGDGELLAWTKQEVENKKIARAFHFISFSDTNIRNNLGITNVFFFPSKHREGTPTAVLQAMSMETVILAHAVGGVGEIIKDHKTGFTYTDATIDSLAKKIMTLREKKYAAFGKQARAFLLDTFNEEQTTKSMYMTFTNAL